MQLIILWNYFILWKGLENAVALEKVLAHKNSSASSFMRLSTYSLCRGPQNYCLPEIQIFAGMSAPDICNMGPTIFVTWGQQYLLHGATNIFYLGQIYLLHRAKYICYMGPTIVVVSNECYLKMLLFFKNVGLEVIKAIHIWTNLRSEFSDINPFICTVYWKCWDESENSPKIGKRKYNPELLWNLAIFVQVHYVIMWRCKEEEGREYVKTVLTTRLKVGRNNFEDIEVRIRRVSHNY